MVAAIFKYKYYIFNHVRKQPLFKAADPFSDSSVLVSLVSFWLAITLSYQQHHRCIWELHYGHFVVTLNQWSKLTLLPISHCTKYWLRLLTRSGVSICCHFIFGLAEFFKPVWFFCFPNYIEFFLPGMIMEQEMLHFRLVFKASRKTTTQWLWKPFTKHLTKLLSKCAFSHKDR